MSEVDGDRRRPVPEPDASAEERVEGEFSIVNEFAVARIRKVHTRNGERLEISAPRLGHAVRLDALALEAVSWQDDDFFSALLETPFGPEGKE